MDLCQDASLKPSTTEGEYNKKPLKMWFCPRKGKVRYVLEKGVNQEIQSKHEQNPLLEPYAFLSSSPTVKPVKKKTNSKQRKSKSKKLEDINQEWGIGEQSQNEDYIMKSNESKTVRSVSFCNSPVVVSSSLGEQESNKKVRKCGSPMRNSQTTNENCFEEHAEPESKNHEKLIEVSVLKPPDSVSSTIAITSLSQQVSDSKDGYVDGQVGGSNQHKDENVVEVVEKKVGNKRSLRNARQKDASNATSKRENTAIKRKKPPAVSPVSSTSKRSRKESLKPRGSFKSEEMGEMNGPKLEPQEMLTKSSTPSSKNKNGRRSQSSVNIQMSPSNLSVSKKNIRGETLLQVASIKVIF